MVTQIPRRIEDITTGYLNQHRIPRDDQQRVRERFLDEAFAWSVTRSLEMYGESLTGVQAITPAPTVETMATPPPTAADAISATQVKWIKDMCGNNPAIIQGWCEKFQIADLSHLRSSQFIDLFNLMSQDHQ